MAKKLSMTQQWMRDHPDDEPPPADSRIESSILEKNPAPDSRRQVSLVGRFARPRGQVAPTARQTSHRCDVLSHAKLRRSATYNPPPDARAQLRTLVHMAFPAI
jgi:hypothetical protein